MLGFLLFCAFLQIVAANNITDKEIAEAYKYFESVYAKNNADYQPHTSRPPAPPQPKNLLDVLHSLKQKDSIDPSKMELKENQVLNKEIQTIKGIASSEDKKKFLDWLETQIGLNEVEKKKEEAVVHISSQDAKDQAENRRMNEWFNKLFGRTTPAPSTTESNVKDLPPPEITEVLLKLSNVIVKLNQHLEDDRLKANKSEGYFVLKMPIRPNTSTNDVRFRRKRETKASIDISSNATKEIIPNVNDTNKEDKVIVDDNNITENQTRRFITSVDDSKNTFKFKILAHLIDSFKEIKYKIAPLNKIKETYSSNDVYKIGYIASSIDTLEANLNKLMKELHTNNFVWDERKIVDFFDKLKASNRVLRILMQYLEMLTEGRKQMYDVKDLENEIK